MVHAVQKDCIVIFTASQFPYVILCLNLMKMQTSKGKVLHICKGLIRKIMTFEYEQLLLLKLSQNKVASNIMITGKKEKQVRRIMYVRGILR